MTSLIILYLCSLGQIDVMVLMWPAHVWAGNTSRWPLMMCNMLLPFFMAKLWFLISVMCKYITSLTFLLFTYIAVRQYIGDVHMSNFTT